ncbi:VOC family protein [Diplocloster hominis]|uniref:VOC family protein n=1 Tax=Diplocloster hominis TaxID=3079010 RepID=UPI0031BADE29
MKLSEYITGVQHLGIPTADLSGSVTWYEQNLGFQKIYEKTVWSDGKLDVVFLRLNDLVIELYEKAGANREVQSRRDGILDHYAIDAPDFDQCCRQAGAKGLKYHASTPSGAVLYENIGPRGVRGANYVGPNQEVIELCHNCSINYGNRTGLQGWSHLAVKVSNLKDSVSFYETLGFSKAGEGYLDTPDGRLYIGFVDNHGFQLELIQMVGEGLRDLKRRGKGHIDHIALDVKDAKEAFYEARKSGCRVLDLVLKELPLFEHGIRYFTILGPDGENIELNQKLSW